LSGDFIDAHVTGSNARILPTDTMKNTVYALAKDQLTGSNEEFALLLGRHFLAAARSASARIKIQEHLWRRIPAGGREHDHAFTRASGEVRTARITTTRASEEVRAGVRGLYLLKTTRSGFVGYIKDEYTTLPETTDRIFATALNAEWVYSTPDVSYDASWSAAMAAISETFAVHDSRSVQHTLYAMGEAVLARCAEIARIRFALPNQHHLLVDLSKFGLENRNEVFVATTQPYGLIEAEIHR
jgi:urate oxidase